MTPTLVLALALDPSPNPNQVEGSRDEARWWALQRIEHLARLKVKQGRRPDAETAEHEYKASPGASAAGVSRGCVLLFGDHVGYTPDEEAAVLAAGGVRCALGQVPLLTSQCMVIAHFLLDAANSGLGPAAPV